MGNEVNGRLKGLARPEAAGGFLPRVVYGAVADVAIIRMELFQFAGEMGSTREARALPFELKPKPALSRRSLAKAEVGA